MESDSKMSNPFFRGFRRENSDFFPMTSRHSAIYLEKTRSSAIFANRRGSDVGMSKKSSGEPILTDYIQKIDSSVSPVSYKNDFTRKDSNSVSSFVRPRREKTESDIVLRKNLEARKSIRETLEARRREVEIQFAKEAEIIRRRSSKPLDISLNSSTGSNSTAGDEFSFIQVTFWFISFFLFQGCFF